MDSYHCYIWHQHQVLLLYTFLQFHSNYHMPSVCTISHLSSLSSQQDSSIHYAPTGSQHVTGSDDISCTVTVFASVWNLSWLQGRQVRAAFLPGREQWNANKKIMKKVNPAITWCSLGVSEFYIKPGTFSPPTLGILSLQFTVLSCGCQVDIHTAQHWRIILWLHDHVTGVVEMDEKH